MRKLMFGIVIAGLLTACGAAVSGGPATVATTAPATATAFAATAAPTEAPAATAAPSASAVSASDPVVRTAQQRLGQYLGVDGATLQLQQAETKDWPDSALGCPAPDTMYSQVVTPGWLLVFSDGSATYLVHTDKEQTAILCTNNSPTPLDGTSATPGAEPAASQTSNDALLPEVQQAVQLVSQDLGVAASAVTVKQAEETTWNDSSLGCAKPNEAYMQVLVPGFRIVVDVQGQEYIYHIGNNQAIHCDQPGA